MKRDNNEDNYLVYPEQNLFAVFDGMGGHAAGEVASGIAVREMKEFFELTGKDPEATWPFKDDRSRSYDENRLVTADRKSTRLNSSHGYISYAVFCLKKKMTHTSGRR